MDSNDFQIFYNSAKVFLTNPKDLYEKSNYIWDFRYLPLSTILFIPFSFFDFQTAFIFFNITNFILNLIIPFFIFKIILIVKDDTHEKDNKRPIVYISLFLMGVPHILNYIYGQVNLYVTLFVILALYLYLKNETLKDQILPSFLLGLSILIKPTSMFLIPFLVILRFDKKCKRFNFESQRSILRIGVVLIPIILNFIPFIIFPKMWSDFIYENISGSFPFSPNFSMSLTKNLMNFFYYFNVPYSQLSLLLIITGILGGLGLVLFILRDKNRYSLIFGFTLGILIMFLTYYDTWDHHLLNLIPLLMIIIFVLPRKSLITKNQIKPTLFFFSFFNLAFVGVWYLTYYIFPYNFLPVIAFFICFYGVSKGLFSWNQENFIKKNQIDSNLKKDVNYEN
jgi:hypothetical protein